LLTWATVTVVNASPKANATANNRSDLVFRIFIVRLLRRRGVAPL